MTYGFKSGDLDVGKTIQVFESMGLGVAIPRLIYANPIVIDWSGMEIHEIIGFQIYEYFKNSTYFYSGGCVWK